MPQGLMRFDTFKTESLTPSRELEQQLKLVTAALHQAPANTKLSRKKAFPWSQLPLATRLRFALTTADFGRSFRKVTVHRKPFILIYPPPGEGVLRKKTSKQQRCIVSTVKQAQLYSSDGKLIPCIIKTVREERKRALNEKDVLTDLGDSITIIHDATTKKDTIVMDNYGHSFEDAPPNKLFQEDQLEIGVQVLMNLRNLHSGKASSKGTSYIHGDLSEGNCIWQRINEEITVKLVDYEYTLIAGPNKKTGYTTTSVTGGTAFFSAPELKRVVSGTPTNPTVHRSFQSDIFAVGQIFSECFSINDPVLAVLINLMRHRQALCRPSLDTVLSLFIYVQHKNDTDPHALEQSLTSHHCTIKQKSTLQALYACIKNAKHPTEHCLFGWLSQEGQLTDHIIRKGSIENWLPVLDPAPRLPLYLKYMSVFSKSETPLISHRSVITRYCQDILKGNPSEEAATPKNGTAGGYKVLSQLLEIRNHHAEEEATTAIAPT